MKSAMIKALLHSLLIFISLLSLNTQAHVEITCIHNDALGTPVAGTDEQGNVKWRAHYQPYGEERLGERQLFGVRAGYTGHRDDSETGLTYMGARYYSPTIGRFMGIDPAGVNESNLHSFNRYAYANNNPYRYTDPNGESPVSAGLVFIARETGVGYGLGVIADSISQYAAFGEVDLQLALTSNAAIAGGEAGLLSGVARSLVKGVVAAKGTRSIDDLIKGSKPGDLTKGRSTIFDRKGGFGQANKDFDSLNPSSIKDIPNGRVGKLSDGRTAIVRSGSKDGRPTLEIQKGKNKTKFRFDE